MIASCGSHNAGAALRDIPRPGGIPKWSSISNQYYVKLKNANALILNHYQATNKL